MPTAHQVNANRFASADQVAQRLLLIAGNPDRVEFPRQQQPDQQLGVPKIGLDPIAARPRDLARRRHDALHATLGELARESVPRRPGLIRSSHRTRQASAEPRRPESPFIRNVRNSPLSASSTAATIFVACTSKPTRDLAFAMAGSSYSVVDRLRGGYRAARTTPHDRRRGTGLFYTTGRTVNLNPYGLGASRGPSQQHNPSPSRAASSSWDNEMPERFGNRDNTRPPQAIAHGNRRHAAMCIQAAAAPP